MKKHPLSDSPIDLLWTHKETTYFQFPRLSLNQHVAHAVFTRLGGTSVPPFDSLNSSYTVDDHVDKVRKNLNTIQNVLGARDLMFMNQPHGDRILVIRQPDLDKRAWPPSVDAMITNVPGIALMVNQADCQGIIIFDPISAVVANVHCGWRGNVTNIPAKVGNELLSLFLIDAWKHLEPGGHFYVVTITGIRKYIERSFKEVFGNYKKIKQGKTYTVAMTIKQ